LRSRPPGVSDTDLRAVLADGWGPRLAALPLSYAPVGAGSYHWRADRFFVTVDDLDNKPWLGTSRDAVLGGLRAAMDTACTLAALPFVLAPIPARAGSPVHPLGDRYAVTVFPYLDGSAGEFGQRPDEQDRAELQDMLAALHNATSPAPDTVPSRPIALPGRATLEAALEHPPALEHPSAADGPYAPSAADGPYAVPVRALLAEAAPRIRDLLAIFDRLAATPDFAAVPLVITHGEPHPGNVLRTAGRLMLIDWDTVGLAPPERDLWFLAAPGSTCGESTRTEPGRAEFARYEAATGYRPAPAALDLYRLRWQLDDIAAYLSDLLHATEPTADADQALYTLQTLTHQR
jgi:spectinomycin phosphotransferase